MREWVCTFWIQLEKKTTGSSCDTPRKVTLTKNLIENGFIQEMENPFLPGTYEQHEKKSQDTVT